MLEENSERKNTPVAQVCVLPDAFKRLQAYSLFIFGWTNASFSRKFYFRGSRSHMFYYQQLSIACYQVNLYSIILSNGVQCL